MVIFINRVVQPSKSGARWDRKFSDAGQGRFRHENWERVMLTRRAALRTTVAASCCLFNVKKVLAQSYPIRLVKLVVPVPPGAVLDRCARLVADQLSSSLGRPFIIENRAGGANGTLGVKSAASATPDGYTLLASSPGPLVTAPAIYKTLGYD